MNPEAFFITMPSGAGGQRFCLLYPAQGGILRGQILYIHPFAEEMNKSRRMAALQARAFAQAGWTVLQIDLFGCGDSAGDFGDATWQYWISDVVQSSRWLRSECDSRATAPEPVPLWLWGLRAGCLLAAHAAHHMDEACNFIFWQAPATGKSILQQFLRLKVAGEMLSGGATGVMAGMRQRLLSGAPLEITGYMLSSDLANGLEHSNLMPPALKNAAQRLEWFNVSSTEEGPLNPASTTAQAQWHDAGFNVRNHRVCGPAFWQTSEIEIVPTLIQKSTQALYEFPSHAFLDAA